MNLARPFTPTTNRRLNELIGFLIFVFAILLVLSLVSYSPLDPSLNTAANPVAGRPAHNWIGVFGAFLSDLVLQLFGVSAFLLPAFLAMYSLHWFRSRAISSPWAKVLGGSALVSFIAALIGLLPAQVKWKGVIPSEGLIGRIVADFLIHYLNVVGAYLVCIAVIAVGLYLSTAFSFGAMRIWSQARFGFFYAAMDRLADWRIERARKKAAKDLEKKRAANAKPVVTAQLVPKRAPAPVEEPLAQQQAAAYAPQAPAPMPVQQNSNGRSGIDRMFDAEIDEQQPAPPPRPRVPEPEPEGEENIAVTSRADAAHTGKTTMPKLAGSYKLPSTALLQRPDEHSAINEAELKNLAQVLG